MTKPTLRARLRYAFDNSLSKGPVALVAWLALLSAIIIVIFSMVVWLGNSAPAFDDGTPRSFLDIAWMAMMRTLDAGTMGGDTGSWAFLLSMFGVTVGGVFIISAFIGILTSGLESKIEELRKGRSQVLESNHTVILGWSPQVFNIVSELVEANASRRGGAIVILGDKDKVEMEDAIRERVPNWRTTRVVCRSGSPMEMADLGMVNLQESKSIIILSPEDGGGDTSVIKTMLAVTNSPTRRKEPYHIVAEIHDPKNMEAARLVGRDEAKVILVGDLISRITVQTCRQSGLSVVYTELLDFGGDEIYFKEEPSLVGKSFGDVLSAYEDSAVMGVFKKGQALLNPPMTTPIEPGDQLIVIAEDDDAIALSGKSQIAIDEAQIRQPVAVERKPERALILGWNWRLPSIITELDKYVAPGSRVTVVADREDGDKQLQECCGGELQRQAMTFVRGDTSSRRVLESLKLDEYDHIILLCSDELGEQEADAQTLITLLHLRDMSEKSGKRVPIVSEMIDIRNRELAEVTKADDFVVSDKLVGLLMTQISENKELDAVFRDLFDPEGSELYLKPIESYVALGVPVSFYTVIEAARRRGEVAVGYRIKAFADDSERSYGVVVNPEKSEMVKFAPGDRVVVVAED